MYPFEDDQLSNFRRIMRLQNLFGGAPPDSSTPSNSFSPDIPEQYQPQTDITNQYKQTLMNPPIREDPGKMRAIGAVLAGLGSGVGPATFVGGSPVGIRTNPAQAFNVSNAVANAPFEQKLQDWQTNTDRLGKGAQLEEQTNVAGSRAMLAKGTQDIARERNEIAQNRVNFEREKSDSIKDFKLQELQFKMDKAESELNQRVSEANNKQNNAESLLNLRQAQLAAMQAKADLDRGLGERKLEETTRQHEAERTNWERQRNQYDEYLKQKGLPPPETTSTSTELDAEGKPVKSIVTKKNQQPEKRVRVRTADGKTGTVSESESRSLPPGWSIIQ